MAVRNETVMTRFSPQEMIYVEELRKRVNCKTNGKLFRNIILTIALHPEFDFLAHDVQLAMNVPDIKSRILLLEKLESLLDVLGEEKIIDIND